MRGLEKNCMGWGHTHDGHCDSMMESAQWADSMKTKKPYCFGVIDTYNFEDKQTHRLTNIATTRLNRPRGRFSAKSKLLFPELNCPSNRPNSW